MLRPSRSVRVTSKAELEAAFATADRITVEGDDELLTYALNRAASDPTTRVAVEAAPTQAAPAAAPRAAPPLARAAAPTRSRGRLWIVALAVAVLEGATVAGWLVLSSAPLRPVPAPEPGPNVASPAAPPAPGADQPDRPPPAPAPQPAPETIRGTPATDLPAILWPLVAIVAIVALFLIARQAIAVGNNVTIQWKVTEKVSGRVVITRVKDRVPASPKAA